VAETAWPFGVPTSFCEYHTGVTMQAQYHLVSLITSGALVKYPNLHVVFNEYGVAWLPFVMWRLDMEYRAARDELPWLTELPSEYIRQRVRFTTQPLEEPNNPQDLVTLLSLVGGEDMLMFSSDYPHWDADNPDRTLRGFSEEARYKIFYDNARRLLNLEGRLRAPVAAG
jgi:predicted TIM-barrel fold metal-dependent hydrolase